MTSYLQALTVNVAALRIVKKAFIEKAASSRLQQVGDRT